MLGYLFYDNVNDSVFIDVNYSKGINHIQPLLPVC